MMRDQKSIGMGSAFVIASLFLMSFGMTSHNAFADLIVTHSPVAQSMAGMGASPDSDVVFLNQMKCLNSLIAKGEFSQMWHSCLHGP